MSKVVIQALIPADEGNACPTVHDLNKLGERALFATAVEGGYIPEGTDIWPFDIEVNRRPTPDETAYEFTGVFYP